MSYSNMLRLLQAALDDGGVLRGSSDSNFITLDAQNDRLEFDGIDVALGDGDLVVFGDDEDVVVQWAGSYLTASDGGLWDGCPSPLDPAFDAVAFRFFEDFTQGFDATNVWAVTEDDAACTQVVQNAAGGTLLLTNTAVDDNAQQICGKSEAFKLAAGKTLWFEARVKVSDATESDLIVGLVADGEDMTGVADNRFADGIGFFKADGATALQFGASKNGTDTGANTNVGTVTTGWHTIAFRVDGLTSATPYFDGVAGTPISATFCDDEALSPIAMIRNGAGAAKTLEVDYVKVVQVR